RQPDVLARTGGDEFAILLSGVNRSDDATEVAERIRGALAIPFTLSDFEVRIGCSIGIALGACLAADHED
ncbi:diguanylate cyclase, partial [Cobetia sp. 3AK]|uniref:diguanylate cyclase domain-containing protein n=2 Tax=Pseudomonadota TaxID=1224 RepID=UPI00244969F0